MGIQSKLFIIPVIASILILGVLVSSLSIDDAFAKGDGQPKVTICHVDQDTGEKKTITISNKAVDKHKEKHGDEEGPCVDELDGQYRTQTQGGWGTECKGTNPGCYRDANFDDAFGAELLVGDAAKFTGEFTDSEAVKDFLPTGGPDAAFDQDYIDPVFTSAGRFAGQVTALSLNVGFDMCSLAGDCDTFAPDEDDRAPTTLADLTVVDVTSACFEMTVGEILDEANLALSDQASDPELSDLNDCVSDINENFVDGDTDNGFLAEP